MKLKTREPVFQFLLLLPALFLLGFFFVLPAFGALYYSLTDQKLVGQRSGEVSFIGLDNYVKVFQDQTLATTLVTSLVLLAAAIVLQQGMGFAIAQLLENKAVRFRRFVHACVYSGWLMPEVAVAFIFFLLFSVDGLVNREIMLLGGKNIAWLIDHPVLVIVLAQLWSGTACTLVTFEHGLASIPAHTLDSARTDGATGIQVFYHIILPELWKTVRTNTCVLTLNNIGTFGLIYMLTGGGPLFRSTNLPVLVFRSAISGSDTGYGLALSFVLFCLCMLVSTVQVRLIHDRTGETEWA